MCLTVDTNVRETRKRSQNWFLTPPKLTFESLMSFIMHPYGV